MSRGEGSALWDQSHRENNYGNQTRIKERDVHKEIITKDTGKR